MGREGDTLLTAAELSEVMGLRSPQQVLDLRQTDVQFPDPVGRRNRSLVWSWSDVELWSEVQSDLVGGALGTLLTAFVADCRGHAEA